MQERLSNSCHQLSTTVDELAEMQADVLIQIGHQVAELFTRGGQLILAGNGPLQAIAQQTATAFSHRLGFERPPLPAIALGGNQFLTAALLADQQPQEILAREYRMHSEREHMLLIFYNGEHSPQINHLIDQFEDTRALVLIGPATEDDSTKEGQAALRLKLPNDSPARLIEIALICGHLICELVEGELFGV
jgi:D-sedoheptulose 7-phosphate isomerase